MSNAIKNHNIQIPVVAVSAVPRKRFVSPDGGLPTAGGNTIGVNDFNVQSGETMFVDHLGITHVEAGAAIAAGADIMTDAQGRAIAFTGTNTKVARLAPIQGNIATAAGQMVAIVLLSN